MKRLYALIILLALSFNVYSVNHYIRAGATGSANGSDWTNAWTSLTAATYTRGDTYYVADGSYGPMTFNTAASGTSVITIKKAIVSDHGTETGWVSTYGDGQAIIDAPVQFSTAYWTFNGQVRNESDWFDRAAYGFKIASSAGYMNPTVYMYGSNVNLSYTWIIAEVIGTAATRTLTLDYEGPTTTTGTVVSHCLTENGSNQYLLRNVNGATVEYCGAWLLRSNANNHGENVNLYGYFGNSDNVIIRYNIFKDNANVPAGQYSTAVIAIVGTTGNRVYGNVFANNYDTDGVIGWSGDGPPGYEIQDFLIYNNTFVNNGGFNAGIMLEADSFNNFAVNNLFYGSYSFATISHSYNAFSGSAPAGETNGQINIPSSIFVNYAGGDYRLASATTAGNTLASPYNLDMFGNTRGADGTWDRGAYEFVTGGSAPTISSLTCSPTNFQSPGNTDCTITADQSPTSYATSFTNNTAQCTTSDTDSIATVNCQFGGPSTVCATATNGTGTSAQFCTSAGYLKARYRKASNLQVN